MVIKSFSKINLFLSVNKKLKNGLHDIQSHFCLVDLFDHIKIKKIIANKDNIKFRGDFAKNVKKKNSILNTLEILRRKKIITNHYSVLVDKKIPVFAGLGGGTSNAFFLTKHFIKSKIDNNLFNILAKKIGSDFRLFSYNQGFLKNLKSINSYKKKYKLHFLIVYPNIKISTRHIYSKVVKYSSKFTYNFNKISNKDKFIKLLQGKNNDLQKIVEKKYPVIKKLIIDISHQKGCCYSRISGSGSVCYGLFKSSKNAKSALMKVKKKYPNFWSSVAKTI